MFFTFLAYVILRIWLWATRRRRVDRFVKFANWTSNDPFEYGLLCGPDEAEIEQPKLRLKHTEDVIDIFAQNSKEQILFARISRLGNGLASMSFYIRLGNKGSWKSDSVSVDRSWSDGYAAAGLRIEIIQLKQRWRVSFNGVVRDDDDNECHLRAVFVGNFISGLGDYKVFHDEKFLAKQLAESSFRANPNSLRELDIYVQPFSLTGKVFVNDIEEEVFVWGYRRKQMLSKEVSEVQQEARITLYTKNGLGLDLNEVRVDNLSTKPLIFGHLAFPTYQQRPVESCSVSSLTGASDLEVGADKHQNLRLSIKTQIDCAAWSELRGSQWMRQTFQIVRLTYDGNPGYGLSVSKEGSTAISLEVPIVRPYVRLLGAPEAKSSQRHVLLFTEQVCQNEALTGGKGSSLAVLTDISRENATKFSVPRGLCVTTRAYRKFASSSRVSRAIENLVSFCGTRPSNDDLSGECEKTTKIVASAALPSETSEQIRLALEKVFGSDAYTAKFAVRSSACGEDSEDMSAAGQMETFLGVSGLDAVAESVAKCWASQFSFVAVQYKRRYGQPVDSDMCVVIQEMVPSDVSGVMFTVDPISGNPLSMSITANFGLGESVVSAAADPDTFVVKRAGDGLLSIDKRQLGLKNLSTVLSESGGTQDVQRGDRSREQSLSDAEILRLAEVGLLLEDNFASPRDIEWAFHEGQLYMLQARPVTSTDNIDTEFEYLHESDGGLAAEFDSLSKANIGEVFGGSPSTMLQAIMPAMFLEDRLQAQAAGADYGRHPCSRFEVLCFHHSQCFFTTSSSFGDFAGDDIMSKGFAISIAGRLIDDDIVIRSNRNKSKYRCPGARQPGFSELVPIVLKSEKITRDTEAMLAKYKSRIDTISDLREMLIASFSEPILLSQTHDSHMKIIKYGSFMNVILLSLLAHAEGGFTTNVFADFALLVSSCNNILSAGVPQSLHEIACAVSNDYGSRFVSMDPQEALSLLREGSTKSAALFREFLLRHGHRSIREFDTASRSWSMDPLPLIKTLQSMVNSDPKSTGEKPKIAVEELLEGMKIELPWFKKQILKFILSHVRKGIALRERTKSGMIDGGHKLRLNLRLVAKRMVREGRLPDEDLLFHLSPNEILTLIDTRNPRLVVRAMNRMKNADTAARAIYPEHIACPPFVPTNMTRELVIPPTGARSMKGTPVSKGRIVATARVVARLEDAHEIRKGDILITYATDIGWSPYFPLLGGVVTELGGLISHGAVVAREYGLPCVVGCHGATHLFQSGEEIMLDGNAGTVSTTSS
ncbi:uncharacterized protein LOC100902626 [Galendromus occidentalis]|uniref:Uncharacterized protein LOC100902626 n=1 Tax=Galendromus occidentalis TaxID=34638 RepID=A0AAJ6QPV1_9ACAR|nr:uncharacterized protein LOC100902626 [Galendromus occidentalis]